MSTAQRVVDTSAPRYLDRFQENEPAFESILFVEPSEAREPADAPAFFVDLNLDQIVETITASRQSYDLRPFFYAPLRSVDAIAYRHEVLHDLERKPVSETVAAFTQQMRAMREKLATAGKLHYPLQKQALFLDAVEIYTATVRALLEGLESTDPASRGLRGLRGYLAGYVGATAFTELEAETARIKANLATVRYSMLIKDSAIKVRRYGEEADYSVEVLRTFDKFKQGDVKGFSAKFRDSLDMNHVEAKVLEFVAQLHPDIFGELQAYCTANANFLDPVIRRFDREVQFYAAYLEHVARFTRAGQSFCFPTVSDRRKAIHDREAFDLALANKLVGEGKRVVCNDFELSGKERIIVVSGPNQGGKTTFARMFGQLHYLAALGLPVPGRDADLFLFDQIFTHFEREESIETLHGKLEDDLVRMHEILERATPQSVIIINEIFTSTTLQDAVLLGKAVIDEVMELDAICVCVTFLDELASLSEKTVSMMSTVVPDNPADRTFKVVRRPADGLAYALSIAEKYRVTQKWLKERVRS